MEILAHLIMVGFATYVILNADPGSSPFSWHPTCMVLAWVLLTEGVLLFRKPKPGLRVNIHWALQASGMTLAICGFLAIYNNKESNGKPHFTTYHSICGAISLVLLIVQSAGGNFAKFSVTLSKTFRFLQPKLIKKGHKISGALSLLGLSTTVFLALFSFWFNAVTESAVIWWTISTLVLYPLVYTLKTTYF